jgi:hypothetical protein
LPVLNDVEPCVRDQSWTKNLELQGVLDSVCRRIPAIASKLAELAEDVAVRKLLASKYLYHAGAEKSRTVPPAFVLLSCAVKWTLFRSVPSLWRRVLCVVKMLFPFVPPPAAARLQNFSHLLERSAQYIAVDKEFSTLSCLIGILYWGDLVECDGFLLKSFPGLMQMSSTTFGTCIMTQSPKIGIDAPLNAEVLAPLVIGIIGIHMPSIGGCACK